MWADDFYEVLRWDLHWLLSYAESETIPASKKQRSGKHLVTLVGSHSVCSKLSCRNALHFSKPVAKIAPAGVGCVTGGSNLLGEQHSPQRP